jgi:hypothetical protein
MTAGQFSLSNRLLPSSRPHLSRPRGVYDKKVWRDVQADDETITLSSSGSEQSNGSAQASDRMTVSCTSPALLVANVTDAYKKLHYQCATEIYEVKHTFTQPLEEIVESVMGLFNADGFKPMSHGEHVAELRQKAAWMGRFRVGPKNKKKRKMLGSRNITVVNENCVTTSNEGPGHKDRKEAYECVCESSDISGAISSKEEVTVKIDNDSPAQDPHERGKVLVKARWINNYHKYNEVRKKEQLENFHIGKASPKRLGMEVSNNEIITERKGGSRQKRHIKADAPQPSSCSDWSDKMMRRPGKYGERSGARLPAPTKGKPVHEKQGGQGESSANTPVVEHARSNTPLLLSPTIAEEITTKLQHIITNFQSFHP